MTLDKIVYDVRERLNEYSDDTEISNEYIMHLINIHRAVYLRQELNNFNRTKDISTQQKLCVSTELVSINECGLDLECDKILRTTMKLPEFLELHTKPAIVNIKPTNRISIPFNFVTKERVFMLDGAPFSKSIYAFLDTDNYVYLYSKSDSYKFLECITITGIFADPLELKNYYDCCECETKSECFNELTSEYPLQPHYIKLIVDEIVNSLIGKKNIPEDKTNDSINDR